MVSTLLQSQQGGSAATWIILIVLLVILVVMYILSSIKRKKYNQEAAAMIEALKPGDKIKTYSGIYGTVVSIRETTDGKVVTLETGDEKHKSYTSVDASVIYCLDKKEDIVYDSEGNIIEPAGTDDTEEEQTVEEDEQSSDESQFEQESDRDESEVEEKPATKSRRKSSKKE